MEIYTVLFSKNSLFIFFLWIYQYVSSRSFTKRNSLYNFQQITRSDMFQEEALVRDPTDSFTSRS